MPDSRSRHLASAIKARSARRPHSTRRKPITTAEDLRHALGRFCDAVALIETVARGLDAAQDDAEPAALGAGISALQQVVRALRTVYDEFDLAIIRAAE